MSFVPLVLRSNCSLLTGTASVERLLLRAHDLGLPHLALTDRNNLYGAIPFYQMAREAGIRPVLGAEVTAGARTAVLLARDLAGYASLCQVLTRRHLAGDFDLARAVAEHQEGLHILTEDIGLAQQLAHRVARDRLSLLLAWPGRPVSRWRRIRAAAEELGLPVAATPDVYLLHANEFPVHRALVAVRENTVVAKLQPRHLAHPDSIFPDPEAVGRAFRDHPDALRRSQAILEDCRLDLPLGTPIFPRYRLPEGETPQSYLRRLCFEGLRRRYRPVTPEARRRLEHELSVIDRLGFTDYFIFVWDILAFARRRSIPTVGRGSGASSIVSYVLGITQADPIACGIPFERFLHLHRTDCPDLDVDLCWVKRDELIASVYERYGADHVAMVSTHCTFRLRSAFRDVARAHGLPHDAVNRMSKHLPHDGDGTAGEALRETGADQFAAVSDATLDTIVELAQRIRGFPRHLGIHCGGLVIGDKPLDHYVPLERAAKGIVVTQFDKDAVEAIGLVKMDLLGNHGLTIRDEAIGLARETQGIAIDPDAIPDRDAPTARLLAEARTLSCCQLESPAMRNLLRMLRAGSVSQLMQALALIRPAPASAGMKDAFVRRVRGLEAWSLPHPSLEGVLDETCGIMLYEDDAMLVAAALAGISREEGDLLRRAISKGKSKRALVAASRTFLAKARANGVPARVAEELWTQMAKFNAYSFCKAHAASYAILAYHLAWLKAHHPLPFMVAVLNHHWGMYPKRVHLEEAKRLGLGVLGPCVNRSGADFTIDGDAIRVGLGQVRDLSQRTIDRIVAERRRRPFASLAEFLARVSLAESEAENLILCGALDFAARNRPELMLELKTTLAAGRQGAESRGLGLAAVQPARLPSLKPFSPAQRLTHELDILGLTVGQHPMALLRPALRRRGILASDALPGRVGQVVRAAGVLAATRRTTTRRGEPMRFVTLEDETGIFEITLFPRACRRHSRVLDGYGPYLVTGEVEDHYGALTVDGRSLEPLDGPRADTAAATLDRARREA
ncbi:MAG: DNA polymerase III subunit alpha [Planctomycetota bacterium]